ncbi:phosphoribosylanthranilate isomerase [Alkaliphilus metalliredigens]|uniref:phosphoribosylanthranilate isomerase n=1 Tax=Alkaliphilus metalliredigens TaxID=208226 RepID=UPI0002D66164|nr:phosphoribosylanthranilate isomerase [Alkaliphilus metalliredigens]
MTKIKICGLKRAADITYVNLLKPDYIGFVFAPSGRRVTKEDAKELIASLDKSIKKVGVFLNHSVEEVKVIAKVCSLDILQFHGDEDMDYCRQFQQNVWKSFRIKDANSFKEMEDYQVNGYLLDTYHKTQYGGTGEAFDWGLSSHLTRLNRDKCVILAGGLNPENVKEAIEQIQPAVVDVSSGVETHGYKDFEKMKKMIERVRKV